MSYSSDVKRQLLSVSEPEACRKAELYGFLLFSNFVSSSEIRIVTAYPEFRARYLNFLIDAGVRRFELSCQGKTVKKFLCRISFPSDLRALFSYLGTEFSAPLQMDRRLLQSQEHCGAFFRGVFMANGVLVVSPRSCSIELKTPHQILGREFFSFCQEMDLLPGTSVRNGKKLIYFKSWDTIKDFLLLVGATDAVYDLANREIEHTYRSAANRRFNCDTANIQRSVDAAGEQQAAIRKLQAAGTVLSEPLAEIARLRMEYPEETLSYLGQCCDPPISKAGAAHRLKKICALAAQLKGE